MKYYDLDTNGRVKGSYAVPQKGLNLHLLEDAPDDKSMRDGVPGTSWIPDQEAINSQIAEQTRIAAKTQAIIDNLPTWAQVTAAIDAANTIPKLQTVVKKLARTLYWLAKDQEN